MELIKCDSCPALAKWLAKSTSGELAFCSHHKNKFSEGLVKWSYEMVELDKVEEKTPQLEKAVK